MTKSSTAIALAFAVTGAGAADIAPYLYAGYGQAQTERKAQTDDTIRNLGVTAFTSSADEKSGAYKLQGGVRLNRHLAFEAGYVNLGKFTYRAVATAPVAATRDGELKIDGWTLAALAAWPFSDEFSVFAKGGVFAYQTHFTCAGTGVACVNPIRSDMGEPAFYGLGGEWSPAAGAGRRWLLRAEYEVFRKVGQAFNTTGTTGTSQADVKFGSVSVGYRF